MIPIHRRLAWFARENTQAIAITDGQGSLDFARAHRLACQMASALRASGLGPGDRFVILSANRREGLLAFMAASATQTIVTPLNTRLAPAEIAEIITDAEPRLILADSDGLLTLQAMPGIAGQIPLISLDAPTAKAIGLDEWLAVADEMETPDAGWNADRPLFQMYTSGTTGQPSGILIAQGAWAAQIEQFHRTQPYQPGDGVLVVTPLFHIAATITATAALLAGANVELPARFQATEVLDMLVAGRVVGTMMVPAMIAQIVAEAARTGITRVTSVRRICYGASPITEGLLRDALRLFGCDFIQGYGLTETAGVATILAPQDHVTALNGRPELLRSAGRPVMGEQIRIAGADDSLLPSGETGEVQIKGPNLFLGYWRNPEKTAMAWTRDGWFRSGDAGHIDEAGYLFIVDRIKDLIISGGENIFPQEVERVLLDHPHVLECAVFGVADARWGETVATAIVSRSEEAFDEGEIRAHVAARLARFKCPSRYLFVTELPRNATGKVLRKTLATIFESYGGADAHHAASCTPHHQTHAQPKKSRRGLS